ncbi:Rv2175c family DNA-binding protein [Georgenia yuyongxinii]|uniref:Helix-turn-helix domain-containing protein n=1 Tax=Georgenia yuyongxinii TaxID=2589797 RepID=A0A552WWK0_9MICO|nr:Rv2175c family DNA-binding protein [Georgenia yuyongxinii]TRW47157.1 helix-turn-helix domain-containing protein [Georgenia yuyongxinii]
MEPIPVTPSGWYSVPEVADLLGLRQRDVRAMLKDHRLLAVPHGPNGATSVPAEFLLVGDEAGAPGVLASLPGTLTLLADSGYDAAASFRWLFTPDDELGSTPVQALRERRTHAVRRVALTLAF